MFQAFSARFMSSSPACRAEPTHAGKTWRSWEQSPSPLQPATSLFGTTPCRTAAGRIERNVRVSFNTSRCFHPQEKRNAIGGNQPGSICSARDRCPGKLKACQTVAGGRAQRAQRHPRIADAIPPRPRRGRRILASLQDALADRLATGGLRPAADTTWSV